MPQELTVIFLLFAAALAFGWFYLQRAKARPTTTVDATAPRDPEAPASTNVAPEATDERPAS